MCTCAAVCVHVEPHKAKCSGGGFETMEGEGEGDGGILQLRPILSQAQLHGQSSLGGREREREREK